MADQSFMSFQLKILKGINYSNLTTTNRAYRWMKNNSTADGLCLNYLKNYITDENMIPQQDMNLFNKIMKEKRMPIDEEDVDKALAAYFDELNPEVEFDNFNLSFLENEIDKTELYLKELQVTKRLLQREHNKMDKKITELEKRCHLREKKGNTSVKKTEKADLQCKEICMKVQGDLTKIFTVFHNLLNENCKEENTILRIDFENFKKIISTVRDLVNTIIENQFGKKQHVTDYVSKIDRDKKIEDLLYIAHALGKCIHEQFMIRCEETEYVQLSDFLNNLSSEIKNQKTSALMADRLLAQTSANQEIIEKVQSKSVALQSDIEKYHKHSTAQEILLSEKFRTEQKLKSDKKRLRKVSDLCSDFVSSIVLQACFIESEGESINLAMDLYNHSVSILEKQRNGKENLVNLFKKDTSKPKNETTSFVKCVADLINIENVKKYNYQDIQNECENRITEIQNNILSATNLKLLQIQSSQHEIQRSHRTIFNGPARQPFFVSDFLVDKRKVESHFAEYTKIFNEYKKKYHEEMENLSNDEYLKMEKTLWILFFVDPEALHDNLQVLRKSVGMNKSHSGLPRVQSVMSLASTKNEDATVKNNTNYF